MKQNITPASDRAFWEATQTEPLPIGWGALGMKNPPRYSIRLTPKEQSMLDKRHHGVDLELKRRKV